MATASTERMRAQREPDDAAGSEAPLRRRCRKGSGPAGGRLGLLGWIALSIHEMNARLGVVETRLIAIEEGQEKLETDLEAGLAQAGAERRALEDRLGGKVDDLARRLPPPR